MADDEERWSDDVDGLWFRGDEPLAEWLSALEDAGAGGPETWTDYDIFIEPNSIVIDVTTEDGDTFTYDVFSGDVMENISDWDWAWDIWEWLGDYHPDVDKDSKYAET